jgi:hypothetical protein
MARRMGAILAFMLFSTISSAPSVVRRVSKEPASSVVRRVSKVPLGDVEISSSPVHTSNEPLAVVQKEDRSNGMPQDLAIDLAVIDTVIDLAVARKVDPSNGMPQDLAVVRKGDPSNGMPQDVHILHISQCTGRSATEDLKQHVKGTVYSKETCFDDELADQKRVVAFLRNPRSHVLSQYYHCDTMRQELMSALRKTGHSGPFRKTGDGNEKQNWPDLSGWLDHWASLKENVENGTASQKDTLHCYLPINLQVRQMSCKARGTQKFVGLDAQALSHPTNYAGNVSVALSNIQRIAHVGITEFYQESMCLFHVQEFDEFPPYCNCENLTAWKSFSQKRESHGVIYHPSWENITQSDFKRIDALTHEDWQLYTAGIERFTAEIHQAEQRFNKKILCDMSGLYEISSKASMQTARFGSNGCASNRAWIESMWHLSS